MSEIYFGLAQWHHDGWYRGDCSKHQALQLYSNSFKSVEGNSSFYAIPSIKNLETWNNVTPSTFKFCFKFPKEISHKLALTHCSRQVSEFLNRISVLNSKLGVVWLQLDQYFGVHSVHKLDSFLGSLPAGFNYAVEVRSLDFFRKDDIEKQFNQLLERYNVDRVIFDTRSLFANCQLGDNATIKALSAKPKVPTHVLHTANHPFIRIILPMDQSLGMEVLRQWAKKIASWLDKGLVPYVFFHTPDNLLAPLLAKTFSEMLHLERSQISAIDLWDQTQPQAALF